MPRFVVLRHEFPPGHARPAHWDLMFERGGALRTWSIDGEPSSAGPIEASRLPDHRLAYLEYEGPVSGDRGAVRRFDAGEYSLVDDTPDRWVVAVNGARLNGRWTFERSALGHSWRVSFTAAPTSG
jgi:hypothetical protein